MRLRRYSDAIGHYAGFFKLNSLLLKKIMNFASYSVFPKRTVCHNMPISAQIEPTLRCNLKCTMCVRDHFKQGDMSLENFKKTINQLESLEKIHLKRLGEPILHPQIF